MEIIVQEEQRVNLIMKKIRGVMKKIINHGSPLTGVFEATSFMGNKNPISRFTQSKRQITYTDRRLKTLNEANVRTCINQAFIQSKLCDNYR